MNKHEFEAHMRQFESFGKTPVAPGYIVLRVDGKGFSKFTENHFKKPFDKVMSKIMINVATVLTTEFSAVYGYTQSDEISLLLPRDFNRYDREPAKLISLSAAMASSAFTLEMLRARKLRDDTPLIAFDSRVWTSDSKQDVVDYFRWRASDAERNGLNTWIYWTLRNSGHPRTVASRLIEGASVEFKIKELQRYGVNWNKLPVWQRRGVGLLFETYMKEGFNPKTGLTVTVPRRRIKVDHELPSGDAYSDYVRNLVDAA